jgi:hypothetical protein
MAWKRVRRHPGQTDGPPADIRVGKHGTGAGDRPVDVCIVNQVTGQKLPCELRYVGINSEGCHEWQIDTTFDPRTERVTIGVLPPRTTLSFPMMMGGDR